MFGGHRGMSREIVKPRDVAGTLRRLLIYFRPYTGLVLFAFGLIVLSSILRVAAPGLIRFAVNQFIAPDELAEPAPFLAQWVQGRSRANGLSLIMGAVLLVYVLNWGTTAGQFYMMTLVGQRVLLRMRTQIFDRIQTLSLRFFDQHEAGDLMSRLVSDTEVINQAFSGGIVRLTSTGLVLIFISVSMFSINLELALTSFAVLPVMIVTTVIFSKRARTAFRRTRQTVGEVSAELQENIAAVREVQAFAREDANVAEFETVNAANRDANVQAQSILSAFAPTLDVLSNIALAIVTGYGGFLVLQGRSSLGDIVAFLIYVRQFYQPVRMIANLYAQLQSAVAGAERIFELLDTEPDVIDAPDAVQLPPIEGHVTFDRVSFAYKEGEDVLQDVSLQAEPGQTVALVGPTGVGKTTLVSLLTRFYDVDEGAIRIDDRDVRRVTRDSLRQQIGIVLQDTFLFSGSVIDNIRYGRLDAGDEDVIAAAKLANAHPFIERLPEGYRTELGERGHNLSQGQRQLVAIARAVLADPRILILDEATSNVDTRTERLIQQALDTLLKGRTSFVIAHRLSTIRNADQVIVLENGRIVERGTHDTLLATGGTYADLYNSQFRRA